MINLLPDETKQQLKAARTNSAIFKYILTVIIAMILLTLLCFSTYVFISNNKVDSINPSNNQSSDTEIKQQYDSMKSDIASAKLIIDDQISYSQAIATIGSNLPTNTVLGTINLKDNIQTTPFTIKVLTRSMEDFTVLRDKWSQSPIFSNLKFEPPVSNSNKSSTYLFSVDVSLSLNKGTY